MSASELDRIREALRSWDPIGVMPGVNGPIDEYDSYAISVLIVARECYSPVEMAAFLCGLRKEAMLIDGSIDQSDLDAAVRILKAVHGITTH